MYIVSNTLGTNIVMRWMRRCFNELSFHATLIISNIVTREAPIEIEEADEDERAAARHSQPSLYFE